ncbi:hypothetical protein ABIE08_004541 [Kaistia defluvii]|uniref:Uncharacterized protein n=1 Tax=Kaistia defluvii TaxID=410841 RepID=A0ABV2R643_9HYPH
MRVGASQCWELKDDAWIDITERYLSENELRLRHLSKFLALYERSQFQAAQVV